MSAVITHDAQNVATMIEFANALVRLRGQHDHEGQDSTRAYGDLLAPNMELVREMIDTYRPHGVSAEQALDVWQNGSIVEFWTLVTTGRSLHAPRYDMIVEYRVE